jgi:hypothetical protein
VKDAITSGDSTKDKVKHAIESIPPIIDHISAAKAKNNEKSASKLDKVSTAIETTGKISESISHTLDKKSAVQQSATPKAEEKVVTWVQPEIKKATKQ